MIWRSLWETAPHQKYTKVCGLKNKKKKKRSVRDTVGTCAINGHITYSSVQGILGFSVDWYCYCKNKQCKLTNMQSILQLIKWPTDPRQIERILQKKKKKKTVLNAYNNFNEFLNANTLCILWKKEKQYAAMKRALIWGQENNVNVSST